MTKQRAQQPAQKVAQRGGGAKKSRPMKPKDSSGISNFPVRGKQMSAAAAYSTGKKTNDPKIIRSGDRVRIIHEELIASVVGTAAFAVPSSFALNPGLPASFPWLSSQAQGWERYRFRKLRFCYYTRTGSNVPGSVMLVPDYDAADAAPISEQIASAYKDVAEDAPWKDICCDLPESRLNALGPSRYVRTGALAANLDVKTYDAGNLFVATIDGTAVNWGKLWVQYDVELITPQLNPDGGVALAMAITGATPTSASLLGTQSVVSGSSSIATVSGELVTFVRAGKYFVYYEASGTTVTQTAAPTLSADASFVSVATSVGTGTPRYLVVMIVQVVVGSILTFDNTIAAGTTACLSISQYPSTVSAFVL